MNAEYLYIVKSFLPEIILVALGLFVLAVDMLLQNKDTRRALTVVAALGCLLAVGAAGWQWHADTATPPAFVQQQMTTMAQQGTRLIEATALTRNRPDAQLYIQNGLDDELINLLQRPAKTGEKATWPFQHLTLPQAQLILRVTAAPSKITTHDARDLMVAYRTASEDYPALPKIDLGLGHPGLAAWWLFGNDRFGSAFNLIFAFAAFLVLLLSTRFPVERYRGEFAGLLLFAAVGLMVMVNSLDLVVLFLGLELASICLYALASWHKGEARSAEAGTKYLLLGSLASAFFIYGASLLFVRFGSTHLLVLGQQVLRTEPLALIGLLMLLVGFTFKVAAAPFHLWAPDVYQGSPVAVAAFLSTASKAAGFAVLLRVLSQGFVTLSSSWTLLIGVMAALSIVVGNLVAVHQNNVKRLLAYSGIAQAGYLLIAVLATGLAHLHDPSKPELGITAVVLYLFLYTVGNIGAFAITGIVAKETGSDEMSAFAGLRSRSPMLAFAMLLLLLSLGGIPLLAGFVGKWFIFLSAAVEGQYLLVLLGAAMSVVSIYYYLLIAKQMYIFPPAEEARPIRVGLLAGVGLFVIVALTIAIGVCPSPFLNAAQATAMSLLGR